MGIHLSSSCCCARVRLDTGHWHSTSEVMRNVLLWSGESRGSSLENNNSDRVIMDIYWIQHSVIMDTLYSVISLRREEETSRYVLWWAVLSCCPVGLSHSGILQDSAVFHMVNTEPLNMDHYLTKQNELCHCCRMVQGNTVQRGDSDPYTHLRKQHGGGSQSQTIAQLAMPLLSMRS